MLTDRQGNSLPNATPEAVALYDEAMQAFNTYTGDPLSPLDRAAQTAPAFALATIAKAHLYATSSEPAAMAEVRALIAHARDLPLGDRERSHLAALDRLAGGEWTAAARALDRHNMRWPRDLLALQVGHLVDFYCANGRNLRDRVTRVLSRWTPDVPDASIVHGMYAFGLEECGDYTRAEDEGRLAIAGQPLDCWAHHAVTHVMEMTGRPEDGIGWMLAREPWWARTDNSFKVHNWWHRALFHLELEQHDEALALYDGPIREQRSGVALDLVDASSLLWRLHLTGVDVGSRWTELAQTWLPHADGSNYPFNDWHAVMALLGAGRDADVERVVSALEARPAAPTEAQRWAQTYGLPLVQGFVAFWRGDHATAAERLYEVRGVVNALGGSHAQRDIIDWTLLEAALRGGLHDLAQALVGERRARKPHSRFVHSLTARAGSGADRDQHAA